MSISNDAGHFFQTTDALETTERKSAKAKNKHGNPIKLTSKILAAGSHDWDGGENKIYVAEAAGDIKAVNVESKKIEKVFTQGTAPLTCIAVSPQTKTLFTGSWDKSIYAVSLDRSGKTQTLTGHGDFVKCLLVTSLGDRPILLSGGADANIIVWDISPTNFGKQLHKLKGHTKALQDLTIDPLSLPSEAAAPADSFVLFSASSDREIRRWHISLDSAHELSESLEKPIRAHDTSVYRLVWDSDGDLWTASADKTVKHLVRSRDWEADTVLQHPDFVRDVLVNEHTGSIVTACRDEEVRVWNASSGKLVCTYSGHFEEVTALVPLGLNRVVSVSIDGTVRQWSLDGKEMAEYQEALAKEASGEAKEETTVTASTLTAEEEAELAELMDEGDD